MAASLAATDLFNVKGQVIVITGGGTGIGAMMAKTLAQNGAHKVYIIGRRLEKLEETAKEGVDGNIVPLQGDVSSQEQLAAIAQKVKDAVGYVNVVIANTGVSGPQLREMPQNPTIEQFQSFLWGHGMQGYDDTYHMNIVSPYYTLLAFMLLLDAGNKDPKSPTTTTGIKSQFVVTSSIAAFNRKATAGFAYGSSKAGVNHLMKQMGMYLVPYHIRVNAICPGLYPSEMSAPAWKDNDLSTKEGSCSTDFIPATRMGATEDMGGNILYMCSRAGAYLNGNFLVTDGGRLLMMPSTY